MRQLCGGWYFRAEKREQEAKHRGAAAAVADSQIRPSASAAGPAAGSDSQTQLHELKKRNDELEDVVSLIDVLLKF